MGVQDLVDIRLASHSVPDAFGIDHHRRSELATIETSGHVDPHVRQYLGLGGCLEVVTQILRTLLRAAASGMARWPSIGATEDMRLIVVAGIVRVTSIDTHVGLHS